MILGANLSKDKGCRFSQYSEVYLNIWPAFMIKKASPQPNLSKLSRSKAFKETFFSTSKLTGYFPKALENNEKKL